MNDIFVSYCPADRRWVQEYLLPPLQAHGLDVHTVDNFALGQPQLSEMERAIIESRHTLLVLSPAYLDDAWSELESLLAQNVDIDSNTHSVLPVLRQPCELPLRLNGLVLLDLSDPAEMRQGIDRLIQHVGTVLSPEAGATEMALRNDMSMTADEAVALYLCHLVSLTETVRLLPIAKDAEDANTHQLRLTEIYTPLQASSPSDAKSKGRRRGEQSLLGFVNQHRYAVITGAPGAGKTIFANHLALSLAGERLGLPDANLQMLGRAWTHGFLLPVRVSFARFIAYCKAKVGGDYLYDAHLYLWQHIVSQMSYRLAFYEEQIRTHLQEQGGLLVLDALDEVPDEEINRTAIHETVAYIQQHFPKVRILVTTRTYAYERDGWQLPQFAVMLVAPFGQPQIEHFVTQWMARVRRRDDIHPPTFTRALLDSATLQELATNPLLLMLIVLLRATDLPSVHPNNATYAELPSHRGDLFEASIQLLLEMWEQPKTVRNAAGEPVVQHESAQEWLRLTSQTLRHALEQLAFETYTPSYTRGHTSIGESELRDALMNAGDRDIRPWRVIDFMRNRAGLLHTRSDGSYAFYHRSIHEYLAACHLYRNNPAENFAQLLADDPAHWREVILLAGAKLAQEQEEAFYRLLNSLCPPAANAQQHDRSGRDWLRILLIGRLLVENDHILASDAAAQVDEPNARLERRIVQHLHELISARALTPANRALAGATVGMLGDSRHGVGLNGAGLPDISWISVEAGAFLMGAEGIFVDEIKQPYWISRYPITVVQYQAFIAAGGYQQQQYWTDAGWRWRSENKVGEPQRYAHIFQTPNHPQVGISWYEATAFCAWLSIGLVRAIALPTEAEWERAACGGDRRRFPWGDRFASNRTNVRESNIGTTTAVGIFPAGDGAESVADMAGNVWEWTSSQWRSPYLIDGSAVEQNGTNDTHKIRRSLRGGAFSSPRALVRCSRRHRHYPDHRALNVGFRIITR